jgi:hypothetical protein
MYVALANFAYAGRTYFVGGEAPFAEDLIKNGLIGYDEELDEEGYAGNEEEDYGSVSSD